MGSKLYNHIDKIKSLIDKGYSYSQIAGEMGSSCSLVRDFCIKNNFISKHVKPKHIHTFTLEQVKKLYIEDNLSMAKVAAQLGARQSEMTAFIHDNKLYKYKKVPDKKNYVPCVSEKPKPERIKLNIRIGQDLTLTTGTKAVDDLIVKVKESYKVIDIYPHCILLARIINKKPNMNIRMCPSIWDLHRMMG